MGVEIALQVLDTAVARLSKRASGRRTRFAGEAMPKPGVMGYVIAIATSLAAFGLNLWILPYLDPASLLVFVAAVALSAWYGGLGPGLTATTLGALLANYFFLAPTFALGPPDIFEASRLGLFIGVSLLVTALSTRLQRTRRIAEAHAHAAEHELVKRTQAQEALEESELRYRLIVEGVKEYVIFLVDPEGRILTWNRGAELILGHRAEDMVNRKFHILFPPSEVEAGRPEEVLRQTLEKGRFEAQGIVVRKDGSHIPTEVAMARVMDRHDRLLGHVVFLRDLSAAEAAAREIMRLNEEYREFVTWTSHELGEPARSAETLLELIERETSFAEDPEALELLERCRRNVTRIKTMLQGLREFGAVPPTRRTDDVDVERVARDVIERDLKGLLRERDVRVTIGKLPPARGDADRVADVIRILVLNAVKHNPSAAPSVEIGGRTLESGTSALGSDTSEYWIRDNGPGIRPAEREAVFRVFARGGGTGRDEPGAGMGLTLARRLLARMGGRIEIEDLPPTKGCTVRFTLPATANGSRTTSSQVDDETPPQGSVSS